MPDDLIQSGVPAVAQPSLQALVVDPSRIIDAAGAQVAAKPNVAPTPPADDLDAPAPDVIEKLESILAALGHELPRFWSEAVALAKKAL